VAGGQVEQRAGGGIELVTSRELRARWRSRLRHQGFAVDEQRPRVPSSLGERERGKENEREHQPPKAHPQFRSIKSCSELTDEPGFALAGGFTPGRIGFAEAVAEGVTTVGAKEAMVVGVSDAVTAADGITEGCTLPTFCTFCTGSCFGRKKKSAPATPSTRNSA
jgi:hypothetical protein